MRTSNTMHRISTSRNESLPLGVSVHGVARVARERGPGRLLVARRGRGGVTRLVASAWVHLQTSELPRTRFRTNDRVEKYWRWQMTIRRWRWDKQGLAVSAWLKCATTFNFCIYIIKFVYIGNGNVKIDFSNLTCVFCCCCCLFWY